MAVLKIPQSEQRVRTQTEQNVDIRLPLSLAQQQGSAFSQLGKVYEDIYKEQRAVEDKKEFYEITREVQKDISKISSEVSKNTDLEFAHKTFSDLVKPNKYDYLTKDKNKRVKRLFDEWLLKTTDQEYNSITKAVIKRSNDQARATLEDEAGRLSILAASSDIVKATEAENDLEALNNAPETVRILGDDELRKFREDNKKNVLKNRVIFGAANNPELTLENIEQIKKQIDPQLAKEVEEKAKQVIISKEALLKKEEDEFQKRSTDEKVAIFTSIARKIKDNDNPPDLDLLNDLFKADQINSIQYETLLRFYKNPEQVSDDRIIDQIHAQLFIAETIDDLDKLDRMVHIEPDFLLGLGVKDIDTIHRVIEKSKDRAVFEDQKFYLKKIDDVTGKLDNTSFYKNFNPTKASKDQNLRTNARKLYTEFIADGLSPEDAFMKVSTGFLANRDRMPTIYDLERVTSISINAPDEQTARKQNASNIFDGWRNQVFTKYQNGNINMDTLKRDLDNLDIMEDMFKARENLQEGFGFKADNQLKQKETKLDGGK